MNPQLLFWVPAALRFALVLLGAALCWHWFGLLAGLMLAFLAACVLLALQLHYLNRLAAWLDDPASTRVPDGSGVWREVYSRLYKLRREDEKNQAELAEWLARFRQAMNLLPGGVVIMDNVLFLEWCNPAAQRHLGLELERDKGRRVTNLVRAPEFIDYIVLGRYEQPLALDFRDRKLLVQVIPFESKRQILVTHDATEAGRIESMRRDFIANASHELRTPLTVINGFLEIARARPEIDHQTRAAHLKLMSEQGRRMQSLVDDMLTLTRLESVDYPLRPERVDMAALLEEALQEGEALSGGRHRMVLGFDGPDLKGSADELRSAIGNLVSNAVRYTPEGGSVALDWRNTPAGPRLSVRDGGIGIAPEHLPRLTERFYRVDKGRSRETRGTGLGLAIVKHVLLRHDGVLQIESETEKGSLFTMQFSPRSVWSG